MERLIQELDKYMKDFDVSYWDESISLDYKGNPMIYIDLIEERFKVCGELLECAFEDNSEPDEQIDFIKHLKYNEPFVDKFLELFNSRDKYVYSCQLNGFDYYLYFGVFNYEDGFDNFDYFL